MSHEASPRTVELMYAEVGVEKWQRGRGAAGGETGEDH